MNTTEDTHGGLRRRIDEARGSADYGTEQILDGVTEAIVDRMLELGLSRRDLADRIRVSPARVTRLLRGANNFTVRTLVEVSRALDCDLSVALLPRGVDAPAAYRLPGNATGPAEAAESRATYGAPRRISAYASRDNEIRAHLASGKLKIDEGRVYMRHESDGAYQPAKFRKAGTHSDMEKTNVGRRAYYRDRIIAVADELRRKRRVGAEEAAAEARELAGLVPDGEDTTTSIRRDRDGDSGSGGTHE
jgi:transcriptional regulator with XRE-family HTH domain